MTFINSNLHGHHIKPTRVHYVHHKGASLPACLRPGARPELITNNEAKVSCAKCKQIIRDRSVVSRISLAKLSKE